ncbi:MAG TPA: hypothetical protein VLL49_03765 [Anaerolineales bacterium]|nr:hypothetical protein [Anaerolineales bacterium]
MSHPISLRAAESRAFRKTFDDGLWDMLLACFVLAYILALYLSPILGDFWSSMVQVPVWGVAYLAMRLIRKHVVAPRMGAVQFGPARKGRLAKLGTTLLVVNVLALILGVGAALSFARIPGQVISIVFGMLLLLGFSVAAHFLELSRLYVYGLLMALALPVGEWLWMQGLVSHHGIPMVFGTTSGIMLATGLILFARLMRENPLPSQEIP